MPTNHPFLQALARALLDGAADASAAAAAVWASWGQTADGAARGAEIRALVKLPPGELEEAAAEAASAVAAGRGTALVPVLTGYLVRVPETIRRAVRRSAAGAARAKVTLSGPGDLVPFLPADLPDLPGAASAEVAITLAVIAGPHQGQTFTLTGHETFLVGRSGNAHLRLPAGDKYFSRIHFLLEANPPRCRLVDMGSHNGTFLNGRRVSEAELHDGDLIKAGHTVLQVSLPGGIEESPPTVSEVAERAPPPLPSTTAYRPPLPAEGSAGCRICGAAPAPGDRLCTACRGRADGWPELIPGYELIGELGRGGMGVVYQGVRRTDGVVLAVKTLKPALAGSKTDIERFLREASVLQELDHPHIVPFHEMGEVDGLLYFVMDYVPGTDAARLLARDGPLPVGRAVGLVCQLLQALDYAHAKRFVHRDVKPANLLVTEEGGRDHVRLADFGLARIYQASRLSGLTMTGDVGGTPAYMPPEQITHYREVRPAADQYSAAATLYNLLTGRFVYDLPARGMRSLRLILEQDPVPIRSRRPDLPEELAAVIHRGLQREPRRRFGSVKALRKALLGFLGP